MSSAKQANWNLGCNLLLTAVLVGVALLYFSVKNAYNHTLQPGQSITIRVRPKTDQLEYSSELILEKKILIGLNYQVQEFGLRCMAIFFMMLKGKNLFEAIIQKMLMKSCPIIKKISI